MYFYTLATLLQAAVLGAPAADSNTIAQGIREAVSAAITETYGQRVGVLTATSPVYFDLGSITKASQSTRTLVADLAGLPAKAFGARGHAMDAKSAGVGGGIVNDGLLVEMQQLSLKGDSLYVQFTVSYTEIRKNTTRRTQGFTQYKVSLRRGKDGTFKVEALKLGMIT